MVAKKSNSIAAIELENLKPETRTLEWNWNYQVFLFLVVVAFRLLLWRRVTVVGHVVGLAGGSDVGTGREAWNGATIISKKKHWIFTTGRFMILKM